MTQQVNISIPMPLIISMEDVGWWSGQDGSQFNQPFRTGMPRDHVPEDYLALAAFGKGLDMKILSGFVLCEWDRKDILRQVPSATWMGDRWTLSSKNNEQKETAAGMIKANRHHLQFALHGVGHEYWADGKMQRTEFHNQAGEMRDADDIRKHIRYFFKLMDQYMLGFKVQTFIPPALMHSFGNEDKGFQKILNEFGIRYVPLVFNRSKRYKSPQLETIAWENNVLLVERGESDVKWNTVACRPEFKFDRPVMALHWPNILHSDPKKNIGVVTEWLRYIKQNCQKKGILLTHDSEACFTQYLHKTMSTIETFNDEFSIDVSWIKKVPVNLVGKSIFLKITTPPGISLKISGARAQPVQRSSETDFLKLEIPEQGKKIWIKPCT